MLTHQYQSLSSVEEYILTVLDGNELYGLDILDAIDSGSDGKLNFGPGTLYPTLRRLEKEGLVQSRWGDQEEGCGGARRKYYRQTPKGAAALGEAVGGTVPIKYRYFFEVVSTPFLLLLLLSLFAWSALAVTTQNLQDALLRRRKARLARQQGVCPAGFDCQLMVGARGKGCPNWKVCSRAC